MKLISKLTTATSTSTAAKRSRSAAPAKQEQKSNKVSSEMEKLAKDFYRANSIANAEKRTAEQARELLYKEMKEAGVENFRTVFQSELGPVAIEAKLKTTTRKVIDIEALAKLVSPETFRKVVSASQKAVTEVAGSDIAVRCLVETTGDENVSVAAAK